MKACFTSHASNEVLQQLRAGIPSNEIVHDLALSTLKPLSVEWMMATFEHLKTLSPVVLEGYGKTGMSRAWNADFQVSSTSPYCNMYDV